jgi:hypothetical protein
MFQYTDPQPLGNPKQKFIGLKVKFLVFPRNLWWLSYMEAKLGQLAKRQGVD